MIWCILKSRVSRYCLVFTYAFAGALYLAGCATSSVVKPYPTQINPLISQVQQGDVETPIAALEKKTQKNADRVLYLMERGRIAQLGGNFEQSKADFEEAINLFKEEETEAVVSAREVGATAGSMLTSEAAIPYTAKPYERIMVYQMQAMNYLLSGDTEGAMVEVRRANAEQQFAAEKHAKQIDKTYEELQQQNLDPETIFANEYAGINELVGRVKNSFQNAYTFTTSAVISEAYGRLFKDAQEVNNAYIDYKKALEIFPENTFLQKKVVALAKELGMKEDFDAFTARFDAQLVKDALGLAATDNATVTVLYEEGFVPQLQEVKIPVPIGGTLTSLNFPIYPIDTEEPAALEIYDGPAPLGETEAVADVRILAMKSLKERLPGMLLREVLRAAASGAVHKEAQKNMGDLGSLLSVAHEAILRRADTRSFLTLPRYCHVYQCSLTPGQHSLRLYDPKHGLDATVDVDVQSGDQAVLLVTNIGTRLIVHPTKVAKATR